MIINSVACVQKKSNKVLENWRMGMKGLKVQCYEMRVPFLPVESDLAI